MNILFLVLGVALVVLSMLDALWTTLWVDGNAGPISSRMTTWAWRAFLALVGRGRHLALSLAGPFTLFSTVVMWVVLLWAGWVFVFAGGEQSLVGSRDHAPADWIGRIYFVAYTMFTMGNGDFSPNGHAWQIATALANGTGMIVVTLAVTYLLSVVSAVVLKRAFASQVAGLGRGPEAILRNSWNGRDFGALDPPLNGIAAALAALCQQYEAYPILQYYHEAKAKNSPVMGVVVLDETLTILCYGIAEEHRPNPAILHSARAAVESFLDALPSAFIHAAPEAPPPPDLRRLRDRGLPTLDDATFRAALESLGERRRKLLGLLRNDGWTWPDRPERDHFAASPGAAPGPRA